MKKLFLIIGAPGSGKTTDASLVAKHNENFTHYSTGDMLRDEVATKSDLGNQIDSYISKGLIVPIEIAIKTITNAIKKAPTPYIIIDGYPRSMEQLEALDNYLRDDNTIALKSVIEVVVSEDVAKERVLGRNRGEDDDVEVFNNRMRVYLEPLEQIKEFYISKNILHSIDGQKSIKEVVEDLKNHLYTFLDYNNAKKEPNSMLNYETLKSLLFKLNPENAHKIAECFLRVPPFCQAGVNRFLDSHFIADESLEQELFGRTFLNPIGLGAGFDKNATMIRGTQALGFGFSEIGTLTLKPQEGNPKPRLFRHIAEKSIQNAMGFNNDGLYKIEKRLKKIYPFSTPLGVNIGKNKSTPQSEAISEYLTLIKTLHSLADYLVINISSPNTPGLRDLQNEEFIEALFNEAKEITTKPILLKIAPDMSEENAIELSNLAVSSGASGIIATNTTVDYSLVQNPYSIGGLSGEVLKEKSFKLFEAIAKELYGKTTLISVGGINSATEAYRRIKAGASLVQIYTALIYEGFNLARDINNKLIELLKADGFANITEAIGADRR